MTKKKVRRGKSRVQKKPGKEKYQVLSELRLDGKYYHRAGKLIKASAIPGADIDGLIEQGILKVYDDEDAEN